MENRTTENKQFAHDKELRAFNFEMRAENTEEHGNHITGRPIVFDSRTDLGWYDEIIDSGALEGTDLKDVRFLVNHDTNKIPLARSRRNNEKSTMQMEVKQEGLDIRVDLDTENNSDARNLYSAIKRGDVTGMSFMFTVEKDSWDELQSEHPTRHITQIGKVFEVSAVTFPAYEDTSINARSAEALERARADVETARIEAETKAEEERKIALEAEERARILTLLSLKK